MTNNDGTDDGVKNRLDALIRLYIEDLRNSPRGYTDKEATCTLSSSGLQLSEIAKILGKRRTDLTKYVYGKSNKNTKNSKKK